MQYKKRYERCECVLDTHHFSGSSRAIDRWWCVCVYPDNNFPYTTAETPNAFQWDGQSPKIAPSLGRILTSIYSYGSPPPNGISTGSSVFPGLTLVPNRQTDRPRYTWHLSNRPHLCNANAAA